MRLPYKCTRCVRNCSFDISGTPDEHLERYLVCPDITMHDKKYQDPIKEKDPSNWYQVNGNHIEDTLTTMVTAAQKYQGRDYRPVNYTECIVDFINFVAAKYGVDYAMLPEDIYDNTPRGIPHPAPIPPAKDPEPEPTTTNPDFLEI